MSLMSKTKQDSKDKYSYMNLHKTSGFREGDKIKILRMPIDSEHGWLDLNEEWPVSEKSLTGIIREDCGQNGFLIEIDGSIAFDTEVYVPWYVLQMVDPKRTIIKSLGADKVKYQTDGRYIKVGCQQVSIQQIEAILNELYYLKEQSDEYDPSNANKRWTDEDQAKFERSIERYMKRVAFFFKRTHGSIRIRLQQTLEGQFND